MRRCESKGERWLGAHAAPYRTKLELRNDSVNVRSQKPTRRALEVEGRSGTQPGNPPFAGTVECPGSVIWNSDMPPVFT